MALNKANGFMYAFIMFTINFIKGACSHDCYYCFMKHMFGRKLPPLYLDEKEFMTDMGSGNFIFVGSSTDMWAETVPSDWITRVLDYCAKFPTNRYLFQSKNPARFLEFTDHPVYKQSVFCTTIETNRWFPTIMANSPSMEDRVTAMEKMAALGFETYDTLEPIMAFDQDELVELIRRTHPKQVNIGRDSKGCFLPEPTNNEIHALIRQLEQFTTVHIKSNAKL